MANQPITWGGRDAQGQPLRWNQRGLTWGGTVPQPNQKMPQIHVILGFGNLTDLQVADLAEQVSGGLYSDAYWTALASATPPNPPPVTQAALDAAHDAFLTAIATAKMGGPADTADKNASRDALTILLRQLALYVQQECGNVLGNVLSSGFKAGSTNSAPSPLEQPTIRDIRNGTTGQLIVRIGPIDNARCYEVQYALLGAGGTPGPWLSAGLFTNSQRMEINGLTRGSDYLMRVRAIGGSTGQSDWSDPVSHMSM